MVIVYISIITVQSQEDEKNVLLLHIPSLKSFPPSLYSQN